MLAMRRSSVLVRLCWTLALCGPILAQQSPPLVFVESGEAHAYGAGEVDLGGTPFSSGVLQPRPRRVAVIIWLRDPTARLLPRALIICS